MKIETWLIIAGVLLLLGGVGVFFLGAVFGLGRGMHTLGQSGIADPQALSSSVGFALAASAASLAAVLLGGLLTLVGIILLVISHGKAKSAPTVADSAPEDAGLR